MPIATRLGVALTIGFLAIAAPALHAQCNITLHGTVTDEHDGSGLPFAQLVLLDSGRSATTDVDGRFTLTQLCPGCYTIRYVHPGCLPRQQVIEVLAGRDTDLVLQLEHHAQELHEVEVVAARRDAHVAHAQVTMGRAEMEQKAGDGLAEMIGHLPGVAVLRTGPTIGKPVINGLSGNRILILNQGVRQEDQQWGEEHAPNLDPLSSDHITVVKGAAGVQYGSDAIGGVVITEPPRLPVRAGLSGEFLGRGSMNGRGASASGLLQGGVKGVDGLGWRVQGSGRYLGDQRAPEYVLSNTGMRDGGVSAAAGWHTPRQGVQVYYSLFEKELGIMKAAHIGSMTDLQRAIASGEPWYVAPFTYAIEAPRQHTRHQLAKAEASRYLNEQDRIQLTYAYQLNERQEYDVRRGGRTTTPAMDLRLWTHTADAVLQHGLLKGRMHGKLGASALLQGNVNVPGTGIRPLIPNYRKQNGGLFLLEHYDLNHRLELEAGARLDATHIDVFTYNAQDQWTTPQHDFLNHALSAGLNWQLRDSLTLRANISSAFRAPHVSELYSNGLHHGAAAIEIGDPALGAEQAVKATADLDAYALNGKVHANLTVHSARIDNYILLEPDGFQLTIRGAFPVFRYVATNASIHGADATVQWQATPRLAWRVRASLVRGFDREKDTWLYQMPADRFENSLIYKSGRMGNWRDFECALTSTAVMHQRRVPPGLDFMDPPPAYHLLGLSASIARPLGNGKELRFGLEGYNLLNTAYRDYLDRFRYYADASGADFSVWVRYSFGRS